MLRLIPVVAMFLFPPAWTPEQDTGVKRLREVRTVYVADLGQAAAAKHLRQEIIKELTESNRVRVVETSGEADAVLDLKVKYGSKNVDKPVSPFGGEIKAGSEVTPTMKFVFRLDTPHRRNLWTAKIDAEDLPASNARDATDALANKVSRAFLKAFEKDSKGRK